MGLAGLRLSHCRTGKSAEEESDQRREGQYEAAAAGIRHFMPDLPAEMIDHALDDGQAEAGADILRIVSAYETFKQPGTHIFRQAGAVILDGQLMCRQVDIDASLFRVLACIAYQIA